MPEKHRLVVVLQPVGEEGIAEAERCSDHFRNGAIHIAFHGNCISLAGEAGNGEIRPLANHLRQLRPALNAQAGEALFLHQVAHRQVAARIHGQIGFGDIFEGQAKLVHLFDVGANGSFIDFVDAVDELRKAERVQLQAQGAAQQKWVGGQIDEAGSIAADDADFGIAQLCGRARKRDGLNQALARRGIVWIAVDQLEGMVGLAQHRAPQMLADQRAGADFAVAWALRRSPQHDGSGPRLGETERELAIAHGGLQHDQAVAAGGTNAFERGAERRVIHHRRVLTHALESQALQRGHTARADDPVPFLIEAGTFPSQDQNAYGLLRFGECRLRGHGYFNCRRHAHTPKALPPAGGDTR